MLKLINIGKNNVFNNINVEFKSTGLYYVLGRNIHKESLFNIIAGLDCDFIGEIYFNNQIIDCDLNSLKSYRFNYVGLVNDYNLVENLSVIDNLSLVNSDNDEILSELKIEDYKFKKISTLTVYEKLNASLAMSLAKNASIILVDNISEKLEEDEEKKFLESLNIIAKNRLVLVSRCGNEFINYADAIYRIDSNGVKCEKNFDLNAVSKTNYRKIKLSFKNRIKLAFCDVCWPRFVLTVLFISLLITVISVLLSISFFNKYDVVNKYYDNNNFEYVNVKKLYQNNGVLTRTNFKDIDLEDFSFLDDDSIVYYDFFKNSSNKANFKIVNANSSKSFYKNEISYFGVVKRNSSILNDMVGRYPENSNEILISSYLADSLISLGLNSTSLNKREDLIGKELNLEVNNDVVTFKVCGIYDVDDAIPSKYNKLKKEYDDTLNYFWNEELSYSIYQVALVNENFYKDNKRKICQMTGNYFYRTDDLISISTSGETLLSLADYSYNYNFNKELITNLENNQVCLGRDDIYSLIENYFNSIRNSNEALFNLYVSNDNGISVRRNLIIFEKGVDFEDTSRLYDFDERLNSLKYVYDFLKENNLFSSIFENVYISNSKNNDYVNVVGFVDKSSCMTLSNSLFEKYYVNSNNYENHTKYNFDDRDYICGIFINGGNSKLTELYKLDNKLKSDDSAIVLKSNIILYCNDHEVVKNNIFVYVLSYELIACIALLFIVYCYLVNYNTRKIVSFNTLKRIGFDNNDIIITDFINFILLALICFVIVIPSSVIAIKLFNCSLVEKYEFILYSYNYKIFLTTLSILFILCVMYITMQVLYNRRFDKKCKN